MQTPDKPAAAQEHKLPSIDRAAARRASQGHRLGGARLPTGTRGEGITPPSGGSLKNPFPRRMEQQLLRGVALGQGEHIRPHGSRAPGLASRPQRARKREPRPPIGNMFGAADQASLGRPQTADRVVIQKEREM